ncbi:MAG TPA: hypothetical protein EYG68_09865 [Leucothrix mucor]|nr:hypothetical protein [Leucothrix mucor]
MYVDFKEETTMQSGFGNGLLWMMSGIMMGLLVGLAMYYFANRGVPSVETASASQSEQSSTPAKSSALTKVGSAFGSSDEEKDPADVMAASLIDKNQKEEVIKRPNFSYYAVLPDLNVPVQTIHNPPAKKEAKATVQSDKLVEEALAKAGSSDFILQVASYRKRNQAERTKGRLKRKGMTSYVQKRRIKGKTWFRVMAGPVGPKKLNNWKATVASLGHKPLIIPIK